MNVYQPKVAASRAALIYLLEPVWAALFSLIWGHDSFSSYLIAGGILILVGNLIVEVPRWQRTSEGKRDNAFWADTISP
jgi:drug/metabolite transporter (DMT)-like permease